MLQRPKAFALAPWRCVHLHRCACKRGAGEVRGRVYGGEFPHTHDAAAFRSGQRVVFFRV